MAEKVTMKDIVFSMTDGKLGIVDGGLAKQCSIELVKQFGEVADTDLNALVEKNKTSEVATESMQVDEVNQVGAWTALNASGLGDDTGLIYAVDASKTSMSDAIRFQDAVTGMNDEQKKNSSLIVINRQEVETPWSTGLLETANKNGIKTYASFESFVEDHK